VKHLNGVTLGEAPALPGTNTLAYYEKILNYGSKFFIGLAAGLPVLLILLCQNSDHELNKKNLQFFLFQNIFKVASSVGHLSPFYLTLAELPVHAIEIRLECR
jgi:hypothetical protein